MPKAADFSRLRYCSLIGKSKLNCIERNTISGKWFYACTVYEIVNGDLNIGLIAAVGEKIVSPDLPLRNHASNFETNG